MSVRFRAKITVLMVLSGLILAVLLSPLVSNLYAITTTPGPKRTAEIFVNSLANHKYDGALSYLSQQIHSEDTADELRTLVARIEAYQNGIERATVESVSGNETLVYAHLRIRLHTGSEHRLDVPLILENGAWKIASFNSLWELTVKVPSIPRLNG